MGLFFLGWLYIRVFSVFGYCVRLRSSKLILLVISGYVVTPWTATFQLFLSSMYGGYSYSYSLNPWCYLTISFSVFFFFSNLQSFLASWSFPVNQFFASGGQTIGNSESASVIQQIFGMGFLENGLVASLCNPRDSQGSSRLQSNSLHFLAFSYLYRATLTSVHEYWKNHTFDWTDLFRQSNVSAF